MANPNVVGTDRAQAKSSLPGPIARQLRDKPHRNASHGTGARTMNGISETFGSMAGIAEQRTGRADHAWLTAFSGALGRGGASPGGITRALFDAR
ncbi:hypothetical protein [Streptomyces sp. bgisy027]|uniref:hypothetical protein n=1 Tax=unclassified Streptomyces TaxID=2593676 RepID=UPI003D71719B